MLAGGALLLLAIVVGALGLAADSLAARIPFAYERALADEVAAPAEPSPEQRALAELSTRILAVMALPPDMSVTVRFIDEDIVNAGATLGGNVLVYRGLIDDMPSENALTMVLAHELAHIKHRHPIRSLGRGVVVALAAAALFGVDADGVAGTLLQGTGTLTLLGFSRAQEREADADAIAAVQAVYGHAEGALDAYRALMRVAKGGEPPALFSTHPHMGERIVEIEQIIERGGKVPGTPLPLPDALVTGRHPAG